MLESTIILLIGIILFLIGWWIQETYDNAKYYEKEGIYRKKFDTLDDWNIPGFCLIISLFLIVGGIASIISNLIN